MYTYLLGGKSGWLSGCLSNCVWQKKELLNDILLCEARKHTHKIRCFCVCLVLCVLQQEGIHTAYIGFYGMPWRRRQLPLYSLKVFQKVLMKCAYFHNNNNFPPVSLLYTDSYVLNTLFCLTPNHHVSYTHLYSHIWAVNRYTHAFFYTNHRAHTHTNTFYNIFSFFPVQCHALYVSIWKIHNTVFFMSVCPFCSQYICLMYPHTQTKANTNTRRDFLWFSTMCVPTVISPYFFQKQLLSLSISRDSM